MRRWRSARAMTCSARVGVLHVYNVGLAQRPERSKRIRLLFPAGVPTSAEEAAAQAAEAAASAGQAAFEAAALAAGQSAEEAAANAAAESAEQSALRDLERRLESGEITEAEFNEALNDGSIPDGAPN